jgi:hypothetical protein
MKVRLTPSVAIAAVVLTVAAPAALGEGRLAGSAEPDGVAYFRANELATAGSSSLAAAAAVDYFRSAERSSTGTNLPSDSVLMYRDSAERSEPPFSRTITTSPARSGSTDGLVEWGSLAIGIGLGAFVLGLGILLTTRFRPDRQLAH